MKAVLKIPCEGKKLDAVLIAEKKLREAGVSFDTGYDLVNKVRDWELDESMEGAELVERKCEEER